MRAAAEWLENRGAHSLTLPISTAGETIKSCHMHKFSWPQDMFTRYTVTLARMDAKNTGPATLAASGEKTASSWVCQTHICLPCRRPLCIVSSEHTSVCRFRLRVGVYQYLIWKEITCEYAALLHIAWINWDLRFLDGDMSKKTVTDNLWWSVQVCVNMNVRTDAHVMEHSLCPAAMFQSLFWEEAL